MGFLPPGKGVVAAVTGGVAPVDSVIKRNNGELGKITKFVWYFNLKQQPYSMLCIQFWIMLSIC